MKFNVNIGEPKKKPSKVFVVCQSHKYSGDNRVVGIYLEREAAEKAIHRAGEVLSWRQDRFVTYALVWAQVKVKLPHEVVTASMWIEAHPLKGLDAYTTPQKVPDCNCACDCELDSFDRTASKRCAVAILFLYIFWAIHSHTVMLWIIQSVLLVVAIVNLIVTSSKRS